MRAVINEGEEVISIQLYDVMKNDTSLGTLHHIYHCGLAVSVASTMRLRHCFVAMRRHVCVLYQYVNQYSCQLHARY